MYTLPGRALSDIPVIERDRFRLRPSRVEDYDRMFEMWQDPDYYRFIGNRPRPSGEVWSTLQRNIGSWALFGFGYWTIADAETNIYIGECGFMLSRRAEIDPPLPMIPEAGWGIRPEYWGKGYTKAAMAAALEWAKSQDPDFSCQCIISEGHGASGAVASSLGMSVIRSVPYAGDPDDITNVWQLDA